MDLAARKTAGYECLDSGNECRLERFGQYVLNRPSPVALWSPEKPDLWPRAAAVFHRNSSGGGYWERRGALPETWSLAWDEFRFLIKPTGFGHVGLFPEHSCHWGWVRERIAASPTKPCRVLNLFAYTGAISMVCAAAGAEVCHVDAVHDINDWAKGNAEASGLKAAPIRWITDDVTKFVAREIRRGRQYDGIILDPPSYGKGPKGEKWILEEHLLPLMGMLGQITAREPSFVLFTCHTLGFSPPLMRNLLLPWSGRHGGSIQAGTMVVDNGRNRCVLPSGFYARWSP